MSVYIEAVVIDNFIIDYILLSGTYKLFKIKICVWRVCAAAIIGTIFALFIPFIKINSFLLFAVKFAVGGAMVICGANVKTFKKFITCYVVFFLFTFLLGGAIIGASYLMSFDFSVTSSFGIITKIPVGIILGSAFMLYIITSKIIDKIYKKREIFPFIRKCEVLIGAKWYSVRGFIDTGNKLYDFATGKPIVLCSRDFASRLMKNHCIISLSSRLTKIETLAGTGQIILFEVSKFKIYNGQDVNILDNITLGISGKKKFAEGDYDLILHTAVLGDRM